MRERRKYSVDYRYSFFNYTKLRRPTSLAFLPACAMSEIDLNSFENSAILWPIFRQNPHHLPLTLISLSRLPDYDDTQTTGLTFRESA